MTALVANSPLAAVDRAPARPQVTLGLDTTWMPIGGQTTLTLTLTRRPDQTGEVAFPAFAGDTIAGGLEVLSFLGGDTLLATDERGEDAIAYRRQWRVTCWDTGYVAIPPVPVTFNGDTLESNPLLLQIGVPQIEDPNTMAAPADVIAVEWTFAEQLQRALPWILAVLGLAALAAAGVWAYRKYFRREDTADRPTARPAAPLEPAHVVALRELERIQARAAWQRGDEKGHHAATSMVVRTYVERRFGLPALERTTIEIRRGLNGLGLRDEDKVMLLELLELTDLVKFAKYRAIPEEHQRIVARAIRFVECTLPMSEGEESEQS